MLSIITASYNYEKFIKETIESVLSQTFSDWELIVVDDGSKDNSPAVIKEYCEKDSRIKLFTHENNCNKGLAETIKLGISKCNGEYICFLESDDLWEKDSLAHKAAAMTKFPDAAFYLNAPQLFGDEEKISQYRDYFSRQEKEFRAGKTDIKQFMRHNFVPTFSCIAVKKEYLEKCDFNSPSKPNLDWFLWTQLILLHNEIVYIPAKDTLWRIHKGSYISNRNKDDNAKLFAQLHKRLFSNLPKHLYLVSSVLHSRKVEKIKRSWVEKFDTILMKKYPKDLIVHRMDNLYDNDDEVILSVCIPTYNRGEVLYGRITEWLKTSNQNFEIVVSDNCSTDKTVELLSSVKDKRLVLVTNEKNQGSFINGLNALKNGSGRYLMLLMDKDFITTEKMDEVISLLREEDFETGYFVLGYDGEKSFAERFYSKTACLKNFAYGTRHPSGFIFNRKTFEKKDIYNRYLNSNESVRAFLVDFLAGEFSEGGRGAAFNVKFANMVHPPYSDVRHSYTYSPEKGNLYFTPDNRFKTFADFVEHLNSLDLTGKERVKITLEMLKQVCYQSTDGYIATLACKDFCEWYNVSDEFKEKEINRQLNKDFTERLIGFDGFKTSDEKKKILHKFAKYKMQYKFKKFRKGIFKKT